MGIRAVSLDQRLRSSSAKPHVYSLSRQRDITGSLLVPGGQFIVALLDQTLELWSAETGASIAQVDLPGQPWRGNYTLYTFDISLSSSGEIFVLIHAFVHHG
jgi:hypothetical protein